MDRQTRQNANAYREGVWGRRKDIPLSANPYPLCHLEHDAWALGWDIEDENREEDMVLCW
jgi:hypothetical protein